MKNLSKTDKKILEEFKNLSEELILRDPAAILSFYKEYKKRYAEFEKGNHFDKGYIATVLTIASIMHGGDAQIFFDGKELSEVGLKDEILEPIEVTIKIKPDYGS